MIIEKGFEIEGRQLVLYALVPLIVEDNMEKYIKRVVDNLLQLKNTMVSLKNLAYGIEWLIVDKFLENGEDRNILCDALGDRMSLLYEYGQRKENAGMKAGMKAILEDLISSGESLSDISQKLIVQLRNWKIF